MRSNTCGPPRPLDEVANSALMALKPASDLECCLQKADDQSESATCQRHRLVRKVTFHAAHCQRPARDGRRVFPDTQMSLASFAEKGDSVGTLRRRRVEMRSGAVMTLDVQKDLSRVP